MIALISEISRLTLLVPVKINQVGIVFILTLVIVVLVFALLSYLFFRLLADAFVLVNAHLTLTFFASTVGQERLEHASGFLIGLSSSILSLGFVHSTLFFKFVQLLLDAHGLEVREVQPVQVVDVAALLDLVDVELHFARELRGSAIGVDHAAMVPREDVVLWEAAESALSLFFLLNIVCTRFSVSNSHLVLSYIGLLEAARQFLNFTLQSADLLQGLESILIRCVVLLLCCLFWSD